MPKKRIESPYQLTFALEYERVRQQPLAAYRAMVEGAANGQWVTHALREVTDEVVIRSPRDIANYLQTRIYTPFSQFDQEEMWLLLLNTKNRVTHEAMVYRGTINTIHVRTAEIFKDAVRVNAPAIALSHNHPSGSSEPSPEDITLTRRIIEAGKLLDVDVLDHIVIGENSWVSLKERGLGF